MTNPQESNTALEARSGAENRVRIRLLLEDVVANFMPSATKLEGGIIPREIQRGIIHRILESAERDQVTLNLDEVSQDPEFVVLLERLGMKT